MKIISGTALLFLLSTLIFPIDFLSEQKKFSRVRTAIAEKQSLIEKQLQTHGLKVNDFNLLFIAYKDSDELELYAKKKTEVRYTKIISFEICSRSGQLGPKRKQGDYQVPEGFYHIDRFNPSSNFYLSLGLNYPNLADKRKSTASNLDGDIFIHGNCVTIGCLPMTDDKIKEIYLYAVYARRNGQEKIPVYIFPFRMNDQNVHSYSTKYKTDQILLDFWRNLKAGYDMFLENKSELKYTIGTHGNYQL